MNTEIITRLAEAFAAAGKEFYLVGGTVRDELLEQESHDIDCATDARPDEIQQIAATTNPLSIVPIGEKFGTIQLHYAAGGDPVIVEVTTYRGERYISGSRKPFVQFGTNLIEDLRRRDFTINAIAKNPLTGEMIDPFDGVEHLRIGWIWAVDGDPRQRFLDDPLRLLRAVRFAAQLGFFIAPMTTSEIEKQAASILTISQERIRDELCKMLLVDDPGHGLYLLYNLGLMHQILPEVEALRGVDQQPYHRFDVFEHTVLVVRQSPARLTLRLAALLHDIAKSVTRNVDAQGAAHFYGHEDVGAEMARAILQRLRFGNEIVERVSNVVRLHMRANAYTKAWSKGAVRRLYLDAGDILPDLLDLAIADGTSDRKEDAHVVRARIADLRARLEQVRGETGQYPLTSPLNGDELMELCGRGPGPWLRSIKDYLSDLVIEGKIEAGDKEGARAAAVTFLARQERQRQGLEEIARISQEAGCYD